MPVFWAVLAWVVLVAPALGMCCLCLVACVLIWEDARDSWPALLGLVAATVVVLTPCLWLASRRGRSWRERFLAGRKPLFDADFAEALQCSPEEASTCVAIRRATGKMLSLPPEFIRPGDDVDRLWEGVFDNPDEAELHYRVEQALRTEIPIEWWLEHVDKSRLMWLHSTFGEFALQLGRELRRLPTPFPCLTVDRTQ